MARLIELFLNFFSSLVAGLDGLLAHFFRPDFAIFGTPIYVIALGFIFLSVLAGIFFGGSDQ